MSIASLDDLTPEMQQAYELGFRDGLATYSWMKDGETWVGTCGNTLRTAQRDLRSAWNFGNSVHILGES